MEFKQATVTGRDWGPRFGSSRPYFGTSSGALASIESASPVMAPKYTLPPRANALPKGLAKAKAGPVGGNSLMVGAANPVTQFLTQVVSTAWEVTFGWLPAADQGLTVEQRPKLPLDFFLQWKLCPRLDGVC